MAWRTQAFTVILSEASNIRASADWATVNNTAGPADYVVASGTLRFAPGEMSNTILVNVRGDVTIEPTKTHTVRFSNAAFATIADGVGVGYIRNDDRAPVSAIKDEPSH